MARLRVRSGGGVSKSSGLAVDERRPRSGDLDAPLRFNGRSRLKIGSARWSVVGSKKASRLGRLHLLCFAIVGEDPAPSRAV